MCDWHNLNGYCLILCLYSKPASSKNSTTGLHGEPPRLAVKIKAPPVEGTDNIELIKFLSKKFKLTKSSISFIKGDTSKQKSIKIIQNIQETLNQLIQRIGRP
ncbi:DUF167 domain-containing protein [Bacteriovoracaceae bacterium]|nr:DUF167 domain-containing protein [Bacteriovoracaceae bacterium]